MQTEPSADGLTIFSKGILIGTITFAADCPQGERERVVEILADVPRIEAGELRKVIFPLFAEMKRQDLEAITLTRDGFRCHMVAKKIGNTADGGRVEFIGTAGRAFHVKLSPPNERPSRDQAACLAVWNLTLPGQSIAWERYTLGVVHLREVVGARPVVIHRPGATHEIIVFANDPQLSEERFQRGEAAPLSPLNHVCQFTTADDVMAVDIAEAMVRRLVDGREIAEPDGIFGARDHFRNTVHMLAGEAQRMGLSTATEKGAR